MSEIPAAVRRAALARRIASNRQRLSVIDDNLPGQPLTYPAGRIIHIRKYPDGTGQIVCIKGGQEYPLTRVINMDLSEI
jgi:hypothetical protein